MPNFVTPTRTTSDTRGETLTPEGRGSHPISWYTGGYVTDQGHTGLPVFGTQDGDQTP